jgi:hypothetical protein
MPEEIKCRLYLGNACNHVFYNLLRWYWLSKNIQIKIYRNIILPLVLYGCETWSLTSKEEHRLRVLKSKVLKKIVGPKMDKVTRHLRRSHNEELYDLYSSPTIIWVTK